MLRSALTPVLLMSGEAVAQSPEFSDNEAAQKIEQLDDDLHAKREQAHRWLQMMVENDPEQDIWKLLNPERPEYSPEQRLRLQRLWPIYATRPQRFAAPKEWLQKKGGPSAKEIFAELSRQTGDTVSLRHDVPDVSIKTPLNGKTVLEVLEIVCNSSTSPTRYERWMPAYMQLVASDRRVATSIRGPAQMQALRAENSFILRPETEARFPPAQTIIHSVSHRTDGNIQYLNPPQTRVQRGFYTSTPLPISLGELQDIEVKASIDHCILKRVASRTKDQRLESALCAFRVDQEADGTGVNILAIRELHSRLSQEELYDVLQCYGIGANGQRVLPLSCTSDGAQGLLKWRFPTSPTSLEWDIPVQTLRRTYTFNFPNLR